MIQAIGYLVMAGLIGFFSLTVFPQFSEIRCKQRWEKSGLQSAYPGIGAGCIVQVDGAWIPEANVQISPRR